MTPGETRKPGTEWRTADRPADAIRVLHVDDDPAVADTAATFLERESDRIAVVTETSAATGLDRLSEGTFDCVISDYEMPGRNGIEFLEAVRGEYPDLPFVLYTGRGSEAVASDAVSAGVTDYLQKGTGTDQYTLLANRVENVVEQYRAQRAVERQRQRFRTLVEESTDVILVVDDTGAITYATPSAERVLGRTPDQLVGTDGLDPVHPDDATHVGEEFAELVTDPGGRRTVEFRYRRPDGEYIHAEARGRNLLDDPVIGGIVIYARDLTDRVAREHRLEGTNSLLSSLFDTLPIGVIAEDAGGEVMAVNQQLFDLFDVEGAPEDAVGTACTALADRISEAVVDQEAFVERIDEVLAVDEPVDSEPLRLADGRTIERDHRPIELPDGEGYLWTYQDVSDRERRRRARTRQEAFLRNSPDLFFVLDESGAVTYQSHASAEILGYPVPDLQGEHPVENIHPEDRDRAQADFERLLENPGESVTTEYRFELPSGEYRWYENRAINRLDDPDVAGVLVVNRDVTERKRRDRELQRRTDRLAEFASIVSHDLRNPLQVARGRLELVAEDVEHEELDAVTAAHDRMERLIDDLLALARGDDITADTEPVALDATARICWDALDTGPARLVVDTDRTVVAAQGPLGQLVENLLRNAVEHGKQGVTVTVGDCGDGFFVADDGPGIPDEERERVFQAGYSTGESGSGLGLRIVEQVAHAHGWTVDVTESAGGGVPDERSESGARETSSPGARFEVTGVQFVETN